MYELNYVRKKKRRKLVALVTGISGIVVASLAIISFLGRFVGTFTVRLETGHVQLGLSQEKNFETISSYLRVGDIPSLQETTYGVVMGYGDDTLDTDETDYSIGFTYKKDGTTIKSTKFFKYTFFVKNVGDSDAAYDLNVNIVDSEQHEDGRMVEDTLRVVLYENEGIYDHQKTVYAKRSAIHHLDENGQVSFNEAISVSEADATSANPFYGYAEMFESSSRIVSIHNDDFVSGMSKRYTLVFWLEGYDPQSSNLEDAPLNAKIKLGVEINAYEN